MPLLTLPDAGSLPLSVRAKALVFDDPRSEALLGRIRQIAPSQATVLVTGETGTGKELVARHIHDLSRPDRAFLAVNCGAFSESLIESELFGHEKGAFTGAISAKAGWFESAHGGTLFLDEVGDLSLSAQVKLLRVLQEGEVVRIGSRQPTRVDVRLIAATNVRLEEAVEAGHFREDLFYRLNVATLALLPLRERPGDILPLAAHFLDVYRRRLGVEPVSLSPDAERRLLEHAWPGNIRELENVVHHALLVCHGDVVATTDLRLTSLQPRSGGSVPPPPPAPVQPGLEAALLQLFERNGPDLFAHVERMTIQEAYRYCDRNQLQTARLLGISRNIVRARLIQYGEIPGSARGSSPPPRPEASGPPSSERRARPEPAVEVRRPRPLVSIGLQKLGLLPLLRARGSLDAALERQGFAVAWSEFDGGVEIVQALEAGRLSLGVVGEGPTIFAQVAHVPMVYLAAEAPAPESEGIIVPAGSPIRSVAELAGRSVALHRGSNAHYLLIRALEEAGLDYEAVDVRFLPPERAREAFASGDVDAWAIWDPLLAQVEHESGARLLRDARGLAANPAYHIARRDFADAEPEAVDIFLDELGALAASASQNGGEPLYGLAARMGLSTEALRTTLARSPGRRLLDVELIASQQQVADTFFKLNLISEPVTISTAQWSERAPSVRRQALLEDPIWSSG